jgi:hypothetical protein
MLTVLWKPELGKLVKLFIQGLPCFSKIKEIGKEAAN